jgi:hypothetical protein
VTLALAPILGGRYLSGPRAFAAIVAAGGFGASFMRRVEAAARRSALLYPGAALFLLVVFYPPLVDLAAPRAASAETDGGVFARTPLRGLDDGPPLTFGDWLSGEATRRMERDASGRDVAAPKAAFEEPNRLYRELLFATFDVAAKNVVVGTDGWLFWADCVRGYPQERAFLDADVAGRVLSALHELCVERGTTLIVAPVPNKETMVRGRFAPGTVPPGELYSALLGAAIRRGVPIVDLRPALASEDAWLKNDTHWTGLGARAAARRVSDFVRAATRDGEPPPEAPSSFVAFDPILRRGDLVAMLGFRPGGALDRAFHVMETPVAGYLDDGELAASAATSDVVLAGTSFSAVGAYASLIGAHLGRRVENLSAPGRGPTESLVRLLQATASGARSLPRVLVFEFPERSIQYGPRAFAVDLALALRSCGADPDFASASARTLATRTEGEGAASAPASTRGAASSLKGAIVVADPAGPIPLDGSRALALDLEAGGASVVEARVEGGDGILVGAADVAAGSGRVFVRLLRDDLSTADALRLTVRATSSTPPEVRVLSARLLERRP